MLCEHPVTTVITALPLPQGGWSVVLCSEFLMPGVGLIVSEASLEASYTGDAQLLSTQLRWRWGCTHTAFLML